MFILLFELLFSFLFEGKSLINVPIILYDKGIYAQVFAYGLAPCFLSRAALWKDKIEKLKWIKVCLFSILHITTIQTQPLKLALREKFQCKIEDL